MCLIVDTNRAANLLAHQKLPDHVPIHRWLREGDGILVFGGLLTKELEQMEKVKNYLRELLRSGRAHRVPDEEAAAEAEKIKDLCRSNDCHVLALARRSGARVLHTEDGALIDDFGDRHIIPRPKGKVYRNASHQNLLRHCKGCRGYRKRRRR